jgi:Zn-dependent M28 family amino/carboxypeptidase
MFRPFAVASLLALALPLAAQTAPAPAPVPTLPDDQAAMRAHVMFLASDAMRGREAGSHEFDIAAQYVAAQFFAAGLKPGGDRGTYLQDVPLTNYAAADQGRFGWTPAGGAAQALAFGTDYVPAPNPLAAQTRVDAPVVFVGYGVNAPQYRHDDFAGLDVRGKVVAYFAGAPASFGGEERAFFGSPATKAAEAERRGAVAVIQIDNPKGPRARPFAKLAEGYARPRTTWARPDGTGATQAGIPNLGTLSQAGAARLFGAGWARVAREAAREAPRFRPQALAGRLSAETHTKFETARSSNVVGLIPGSDPQLKEQVVVLSAHLDHIGVNPDGPDSGNGGDRINNGALDNAIGIASLIEEAKRFHADGSRPRRTVMFLAVTGEEKGLVGSDYFTNHPTVPLPSIVADVNLDMPILTYRFEDMIVYGADRSTLGPIVRAAVAGVGVGMSPDPMPEQGIFVRSDHFRFVQKGVPSVFLWPGQKGPGKAAVADFMAHRYHQVGDELDQGIDWSQGPRFVGVNYAIARAIADGDQRPVWNRGDYFGTLYRGPMAP